MLITIVEDIACVFLSHNTDLLQSRSRGRAPEGSTSTTVRSTVSTTSFEPFRPCANAGDDDDDDDDDAGNGDKAVHKEELSREREESLSRARRAESVVDAIEEPQTSVCLMYHARNLAGVHVDQVPHWVMLSLMYHLLSSLSFASSSALCLLFRFNGVCCFSGCF